MRTLIGAATSINHLSPHRPSASKNWQPLVPKAASRGDLADPDRDRSRWLPYQRLGGPARNHSMPRPAMVDRPLNGPSCRSRLRQLRIPETMVDGARGERRLGAIPAADVLRLTTEDDAGSITACGWQHF
jgi:hypothetical protein